MYTLYILYSDLPDRYYIGYTGDSVENRLIKHLANHRGFTGKAKDWQIVYTEYYFEKSEAAQRERQLKKWKNVNRLKLLINKSKQ
jgi:putative endonuclease